MFSGHLPHLTPTLVCWDSELWCCGLLLSSVNEESSSALFQCQIPAKFQKKHTVRLTAGACQVATTTQSDMCVLVQYLHIGARTRLYMGISAE